MIKLKGKSTHISLENGFWGIVSQEGKNYLPINMPEQLKQNGVSVECTVKVRKDIESIHQWGTIVEIISFQTPTP